MVYYQEEEDRKVQCDLNIHVEYKEAMYVHNRFFVDGYLIRFQRVIIFLSEQGYIGGHNDLE